MNDDHRTQPAQPARRSWTDRVLPAAALAAAVSLFVMSATSAEAAPAAPSMACGVQGPP